MSYPDHIVFVKHGNKYNSDHVNALYEQLYKYFPDASYHVYTEFFSGCNPELNHIPIPEKISLRYWWNKLYLFSADFPLEKKAAFFDLDVCVKNDPSEYLVWNGLTVCNAYWKRDMYMAPHAYDVRINSSIITWIPGEQTHIWDTFVSNRDYYMRKYKGIDRFLYHEGFPHNTFSDGIVNSIANEEMPNAPIDIYNGIEYHVPRTTL